MEEYIMTIDEGTTSARAVLFNKDSEIIAICAKEFAQYYPQPGWVEQDPKETWLTTKEVITELFFRQELIQGRLRQLVLQISVKQ